MANEEGRTARSAAWGVAAGVFAAGAFATLPVAVAPESTFPIWPICVFGGIAAVALYMCFATIWGWWPAVRTVRGLSSGMAEPLAADQDLDAASTASTSDTEISSARTTAGASADPPAPPAAIQPTPDLDVAAEDKLSQPPSVESESVPSDEPSSAVTDRWRHTSDGGKVPSLMRLTHTGMFHRGYGSRQTQDVPPSVKVGMLVACRPIDPSSSGSELRAKFAAFLNSEPVRECISALTYVPSEASWKNMAGHGPRTLEAALTASDDPMEGVPVATALFLPPTAGEALYGRDGRLATLILYVEPRTLDGEVPPASDLASWHGRLRLSMTVPGAFADFLDRDLGLGTFDDPPSQFGVWLQSYQPLTVMVDIDGLRMLPGSSPSNQFIGWAYADPDGNSVADTARDLLTQLCEYELNLDAFDQTLAALNDA